MEFLRRKKPETPPRRRPALMAGQDAYTFRRSRTLTGSASSEVRSAAEDRSHLISPRLKLHQLQRHQRLVAASLFISILFVSGLGWMVGQFIRLPETHLYSQQLNAQPDTAKYHQAIKDYFAMYPTERFLFQLQEDRLVKHVSSQYAEIEDVKISSPMPGVFATRLTFREPVLSWQSDGRQLYIDRHGVAFRDNYFMEPAVAVDDQSGIQLDNTNVVASGRFIGFLGRIVSSINAAGMKVEKIIIPTGTTREVDVQLQGHNYPVKTHIDREPISQAHDIVHAVRHLDGKGVMPEYIDARVAGKAFYR